MNPRLICCFLAASAVACVHAAPPQVFKPAPGDTLVAGQPLAAQSTMGGVRVLVNQKSWQGEPGNLTELVTPLDVTIINDSNGPVPLRYRDFTLDTESGVQLTALPPFRISRPAGQTVAVRPLYPSSGFFFYGPYGPYYPGAPLWDGPFDSDLSWYDSAYQWQQALPTQDMLQKALPEGMLKQGGQVSGYLYFNHVPGKGRVNFQARFPEPETGRIAALVIPLTSQ